MKPSLIRVWDFQMCVINLSDYTRPVRAKSLYNHIDVSDLPKEDKLARLEEHGYEQILNHRNDSPRVVEPMTQSRHARAVPPTLYLREFVDSLENPATIWELRIPTSDVGGGAASVAGPGDTPRRDTARIR